MEEFWNEYGPLILTWAVKAVLVLIIFFIAWLVAAWVASLVGRAMTRAKLDLTLVKFFKRAIKWLIVIMALLACLGAFGLNITTFAAVLGAAGLAIGLAMQGSLGNFAAGTMLLIFRPFRVGDVVNISGHLGIVDEIELFTTSIDTFDNRRLIIPNGEVFGNTIENFTHHPIRRVDVNVGTAYDADLDQVRSVLEQAAASVHDDSTGKEFQVVLDELGDSSIAWQVRTWSQTPDWLAKRQESIRAIKYALDGADINIPFPQRDVHLFQQNAAVGEEAPA